jgi:hypothetical protein
VSEEKRMTSSIPDADYPIAVVQDRYGGTYSGGEWLAISKADKLENGAFRIIRALEFGPHGDDGNAMDFWHEPPDWIAVGNTPDEAVANLRNKVRPKAFSYHDLGDKLSP